VGKGKGKEGGVAKGREEEWREWEVPAPSFANSCIRSCKLPIARSQRCYAQG